jgi:hypothetical protein
VILKVVNSVRNAEMGSYLFTEGVQEAER